MFLIPGVTCVVLFALMWWANELPRPGIVGAFVLVGVVAQWLTPAFSAGWVAAPLLNVCTGIYLAIRLKQAW